MSLIIGAMRDRLILVRGLFARDGQASYQIIQSWAGPAELDVASGVPDIPGGLSRVIPVDTARFVLTRVAYNLLRPGNERSRDVGFVPFGTEELHRHDPSVFGFLSAYRR